MATRTRATKIRTIACVMLVVVVGVFGVVHGAPVAHAYSCGAGFGTGGHCYAINDWPGGPIAGPVTDLSVVPLECYGCVSLGYQTGFVLNAEWALNKGSSSCPAPQHWCWVEAGYVSFYENNTWDTNYYWADLRPNSTYFFHPLASTLYDNTVNIQIGPLDSSTYYANILSPNYSYEGFSHIFNVSINDINIGEELAGSSGGYAPDATFTNNIWVGTDGNGHYQSVNGKFVDTKAPPPYGGWLPGGQPTQTSNGGTLQVYCC